MNIGQEPEIMSAFNPMYALQFVVDHPLTAYIVMGAVVLVVTGVEALYLDMGHFGKSPVRYAWLFLVLPCLLINYLGQGSLLLANPAAVTNPFYLMVPEWALWPVIGLATAATVIASQAVISGAFSLVNQAILLGFVPRMNILHTSISERGQIYIPTVNWALLIMVNLPGSRFLGAARLRKPRGRFCRNIPKNTVIHRRLNEPDHHSTLW